MGTVEEWEQWRSCDCVGLATVEGQRQWRTNGRAGDRGGLVEGWGTWRPVTMEEPYYGGAGPVIDTPTIRQ